MDRAALAARIQEILKTRPKAPGEGTGTPAPPPRAPTVEATDEESAFAARCAAAEASARVLEVLGATLLDDPAGPCVVVDRDYPLTHSHGRHPVERFHSAALSSGEALSWFLGGAASAGVSALPIERPVAPPLLFFDLETTGLSGGAGTYAFLVGFGWFTEGGFHTRQYFLRGYGEERPLLRAVSRQVASASADGQALVTYNGRSFDVPLIDTRYQFNRLPSPFDGLPHVDMLFAARRLWKRRHAHLASGRSGRAPARAFVALDSEDVPGSCALTALERDILGLHREDDVPGWEIPARYFGYARTGDARGLEAVLEHNRLDLVSLAAVTAEILDMAAGGADAARGRAEALALGRLLEYLNQTEHAERCYRAAAEADGTLEASLDRCVRAEALHWLARHRRRLRRYHEAADAWQRLAEIPGLDAQRRHEALEALAIYHEHRAKNLEAARAFAQSALQEAGDAKRVDEVRHRLGRLSKKIGQEARPCSSGTQAPLPGSS